MFPVDRLALGQVGGLYVAARGNSADRVSLCESQFHKTVDTPLFRM